MIKKMFAIILATIISTTAVMAYSRNSVSRSTIVVRNEASLAFADFHIEPFSEVETGSSIIITFTNAKIFSQDIIDGTSSDKDDYGYNSIGYQYLVNGSMWTESMGFYDVMPNLDTAQLPYRINRIDDYSIEVKLINVPDSVVGEGSLSSVNGVGRNPYYSIPLVAYADGEGDITAQIDSNGSSISSGFIGSMEIYEKKTESTTVATTETTTEATTETTTEAAEDNSIEIRVQIGSNEIRVNGNISTIEAAPYIQADTSSTLVPLRFVSEVFGNVEWVAETKTAVVTYNGNVVEFSAGANTYVVNGETKTMANNARAEINNSRMYVPFRALGDALGVEVSWEADSKTAIYRG